MSSLTDRLAVVGERLEPVVKKTPARIGVAFVFLCFHLLMFAAAGRVRLDVPFNSAPGHAPYYSDPDAPALLGYPRQPHYWSRLIVSRWDAQHYIGFAVRGLTACPDEPFPGGDMQYLQCGLTWFPAYGQAGGLIADTTGAPADFALLFLSLVACMVINMLWTSRAITDRFGTFETYAALVAFNLFPSGFYLVAPYTEGPTFALMIAGFVCLLRDRWITAGVLVGASTALRPTAFGFGFALGCAVLVAALQKRSEGDARWWRPLLALPLAAWGLIANFIMLHIFVGDAFAYFRAGKIKNDWIQNTSSFEFQRLLDPEWYMTGFGSQHADTVTVLACFGFIALAGRETLRRFKSPEAVFLIAATIVMMLMPMMASTQYWGLNRYFLLAPLTFFAAGIVARRHPAYFALWLFVSVAMYWHIELCSYIAQGNPKICPCLGKIEAMYPY